MDRGKKLLTGTVAVVLTVVLLSPAAWAEMDRDNDDDLKMAAAAVIAVLLFAVVWFFVFKKKEEEDDGGDGGVSAGSGDADSGDSA